MAQTPGPKKPELYPVAVGEKYDYWGEQPGYIYDPYHDSYEPDPAVAKPYYEETGLIEEEKGPPSAGEQLLPVAGVAGATILGQEGGEALANLFSGTTPTTTGLPTTTAPGMMGGGGSSAASSGGAAASSSTPVASTTLADGSAGVVLADGSTVPATAFGNSGSMIANALPWVALASLAYSGWQNFVADGGKEALKGKGNSQQNIDAGLNSNPITGWINPTTKFLGFGSVGTMLGGGKSTKDYQAERRGKLAEKAPEFERVMSDLEAQRQQRADPNEGYWTEENDPTGKYVGKKWSWESEQDIRRTTGDYTHATNWLGNAETFGDEWLKLPIEEREYITQMLAEKNFYHHNKGDALIADDKKEEARKLYDEIKLQWDDPEFQKSLVANGAPPAGVSSATPTWAGNVPTAPQQAGGGATYRTGGGGSSAPGMMGGSGSSSGGVGGPGYDPDPNRPGHFIKRR
jgi:hypothetical protein